MKKTDKFKWVTSSHLYGSIFFSLLLIFIRGFSETEYTRHGNQSFFLFHIPFPKFVLDIVSNCGIVPSFKNPLLLFVILMNIASYIVFVVYPVVLYNRKKEIHMYFLGLLLFSQPVIIVIFMNSFLGSM